MMKTLLQDLQKNKLVRWLSGPAPVTYTLPWLMLLLVIGTISQRYIGLYESERIFFHSWLVWLGPIPFPGLYPTLGVLSLGLFLKMLDTKYWRKAMIGSLLSHIGALLLLLGGLVTAVTSQEGYIMLAEGDATRAVSDYHQRELVIFKDDTAIMHIPQTELHNDLVISRGLPFDIVVDHYFRHSLPVMKVSRATDEHRGFARQISLQRAPLKMEDEENMAGMLFTIRNSGNTQTDGKYVLFEPMPRQAEFMIGESHYALDLRRAQRPLPFSVQLDSFEKFTYPGTDKASDYESLVTLTGEDGVSWQEAIRMNEPVRTHGHTLYQSSYMEIDGVQRSVIAVVKNHGFLFPYIASILMAIGLILHARLRGRKSNSK